MAKIINWHIQIGVGTPIWESWVHRCLYFSPILFLNLSSSLTKKLQKVLHTVACQNHYTKWLTCLLYVETRQNTTIEERVALLEIQVVVIQDEVTDLETDVDFLFDEQVIQDEKLLDLEQETEVIEQNIVGKFKSSN